ncbi:MAG: NAD-dependent epimerase/dehydratase family protein, partial [Nocardioidaceae bacterium]
MQIVIAGASGFLGTALGRHLSGAGHDVVRLVRGEPTGPDQVRWDPANGQLDPGSLANADTVINLGGAPIGHWPWTSGYKQKILDSRRETTGTIASTIAGLDHPPALVNASGINYFGMDRGDEQVDEDSTSGSGFLANVCRQWEAATQPAADAGARVALARTSPVLDGSDGT